MKFLLPINLPLRIFSLRILLGLTLFWNCTYAIGMDIGLPLGVIDSVIYDNGRGQINIVGWTWSDVSGHAASDLQVTINDKKYQILKLKSVEREDVKNALTLPNSKVGFSAVIAFDGYINHADKVQIIAKFQDGEVLKISGNIVEEFVFLSKKLKRQAFLLSLILILIFSAKLKIVRRWGVLSGNWIQNNPGLTSTWITLVFFITVASGITGSSGRMLFSGPNSTFGGSAAQLTGSLEHLFDFQSIRSDEWGVQIPNVLAQWNHTPPFPITNSNIGLNGQNMGVIGMTGVPIQQPAAIARPATWGYFFLPLRQALSWQWQFPFFACLYTLWQCLNLLRPANSAFNLALAGLFCIAPYAAAWSLWPLYATFFPTAAFVTFAKLLKTKKAARAFLLGGMMGMLLAGWVLVLYPPWQISIGTLFLALTAGWLYDARYSIEFKRVQWLGIITSLVICSVLLGSWWMDTSAAVTTIQNTIYPGQRNALKGGDMLVRWALRGYTNPEALNYGTGDSTNSSEISSYIFFPLAIILMGVVQSWRRVPAEWVSRNTIIFIVFCLYFWFFGIPTVMAKLTFWSLVPSSRLDPALALGFIVVLAMIHRPGGVKPATQGNSVKSWFSAGIAVLGASLAFFVLRTTPDSFSDTNDLIFSGTITLAVLTGTWWVMLGRMPAAVAMLLLLSSVSTMAYNPISRAPTSVKASPDTLALASDADSTPLICAERTLVIGGGGLGAMALAASGIPTVNGVFYYPQSELWKDMGLSNKDWSLVNRYQHLGFILGKLAPGIDYEISNPRADVVEVTVDPEKFNFAKTGALRVAAPENYAASLRSSAYLQEVGHHIGLYWFRVIHHKP